MNVPCKSQIKCFAVIFYLSMNSLVQLTCTVNGKKKKTDGQHRPQNMYCLLYMLLSLKLRL